MHSFYASYYAAAYAFLVRFTPQSLSVDGTEGLFQFEKTPINAAYLGT
jgi:hypothetical protein